MISFRWARTQSGSHRTLARPASDLVAGLGRGFPVSGGMSQSLVTEGGGARTPLSGAIAARSGEPGGGTEGGRVAVTYHPARNWWTLNRL